MNEAADAAVRDGRLSRGAMTSALLTGWAVAIAAPIVVGLTAPPTQQHWLRRASALVLLYVIALALAGLSPVTADWAGVIAAATVVLTLQPFIAFGVLTKHEIGLAPLRPGSALPAALVTAAALLFNAAVLALRGAPPVELSTTALAALLLAAPLEELVFRGALLALADRALVPHRQFAGAKIGAGGIAVTVAFIALHGLSLGMLSGIVPAALLYLWLRARTGSLVAPIFAHLAWNVVVVLMH